MIPTTPEPQRRRDAFLRYALLVVWIVVIFFLSGYEGSMSQTSRFIRPILEFLFPAADEPTLHFIHGLVRKFAHFAEYAVLAFFGVRAFRTLAVFQSKNLAYAVAFLLVLSVAAVDETNQSFTTTRTGSILDVLLDVCGGTAMLAAVFLFEKRSFKLAHTP
ncbi:MAG: VanZ family protein [Acidobacteria bacterium]|nr:VanZ family protein [Acidobacteriota bacterium]MCA1608518.1 VanZ family protein [Acidobacteriota bacterium]